MVDTIGSSSREDTDSRITSHETPPPPPPLPSGGATAGIPAAPDPQTLADLRSEATFRKWVAAAATLIGLITIVYVILYGLHNPCIWLPDKTPATVAIIVFVERGLISGAGVLFGYSMLRVAERMLVPWHLTKDAKDVELVRILIGSDSPARAVLKSAKEAAAITGGLLRDAAALLHGESKKKSESED